MNLRAALLLLLAPTLFACSHPKLVQRPEKVAARSAFVDVALFDGTGTTRLEHQDVLVEGGKVVAIAPHGATPVPADAEVVPGAGLTLLPGLVDVHVHTSAGGAPPWKLELPDPEVTLQGYLYAGITSAVDVGGVTEKVAARRNAIAAGELLGPHLRVAGKHFTAPHGHPVALVEVFAPWPLNRFMEDDYGYQVGTVAEADARFEELLKVKPDFVKVTSDKLPLDVPTIDPVVAKRLCERAHGAGLKVVSHIGANDDLTKMIEAGADIFVHGPYRDRLDPALAAKLAEKHIPMAVTLAVFDNVDREVNRDRTLSPLTREIAGSKLSEAVLHPPDDYEIPKRFQPWLADLHSHRQDKFDNVTVLRNAGVTLLVGSDSPNLAQFAGATFHDELDLLVKAGLTPGEVLHAATSVNAEAMGLSATAGTVAVGRPADLLLVEGDPTADIAAVHHISGVWLDGVRLVRTPMP